MRIVPIVLMVCIVLACAPAHAERRQIGHVLGVEVHVDQVEGSTEQERAGSLRRLFIDPVVRSYLEEHLDEIRLTESETDFLVGRLESYSKCNDHGYEAPESEQTRRFVAGILGAGVKVQGHFYRNFGAGRLLFQQTGVEAFDAMRQFLEQSQAEGKFAIIDPALRALAFDYWTRDQSPFLIEDPAAIEAALNLETVISRCPPVVPDGSGDD